MAWQQQAPQMQDKLETDDLPEMDKFEVNPLYYAHVVMLQIITKPHMAFMNGQTEAGLQSLIIGVDHLERICKADKILPDEQYKADLQKAKAEKHLDKEKLNTVELAGLAQEKFELICKELFKKKGVKLSVRVR